MSSPLPPRLTREQVLAQLERWQKPDASRWLAHRIDKGTLPLAGTPPTCTGDQLWELLLREECDKLFNQAWCALDQIRSAVDPDSMLLVAMDDFPSAIEQAYSLAPQFADEHLKMMREYSEERYQRFVAELGQGTDREDAERAECLAFWEENAELITDYRRLLYRLVREQLVPRRRSPRAIS